MSRFGPTTQSSSTSCSGPWRRLFLLWLRRAARHRVSSRPSSPRPRGQSFHTCTVSRAALPTHFAELVAELSDLAPQVFHETATVLLARLPLQHRRPTSGKGSGGSCLGRHRAQCAGAETELHLGAVSEHFDLLSGWHENKRFVPWLSVSWEVLLKFINEFFLKKK